LIEKTIHIPQKISNGDYLIVVGDSKDELGGSEFFEYIHKFVGGKCPVVNFENSKKHMDSVLNAIDNGLVKSAHDCSKGGLAVAVSELCMTNQIGCKVSLEKVPNEKLPVDRILFSESHSRYLLTIEKKNLKAIENLLKDNDILFKCIGQFGGDDIQFTSKAKPIIDLRVDKTQKTWLNSLRNLVLNG
jgi:phosphoribosylformylglycinamidine (FGAM) synthase-like enzyme